MDRFLDWITIKLIKRRKCKLLLYYMDSGIIEYNEYSLRRKLYESIEVEIIENKYKNEHL